MYIVNSEDEKNKKLKDALRARKYRATNKEKVRQIVRKSYLKNREKILQRCKKESYLKKAAERQSAAYRNNPRYKECQDNWRKANIEKVRANARVNYALNIETKRAQARERQKKDRARRALYEASRRLTVNQAVPSWADSGKMIALYEQARDITLTTGIIHQVDHIVPLKSKWVCGLHWEGNMRVITQTENVKKSNKIWPDMPDHVNL